MDIDKFCSRDLVADSNELAIDLGHRDGQVVINLRNAYFGKSNSSTAFRYQLYCGDGFGFLQRDLIDEFLGGDCWKAAFSGRCWRSPIRQPVLLLKNLIPNH